jgi:DNA adenine methylase
MTQTSFLGRPVMRYHGGKYRCAERIISLFPPHGAYVEPFAGAASVMLRKERSRCEIYNDLDSEVVNVFRVLRDPGSAARLADLLYLTPFAHAELDLSYEPTDDDVERARRTIARSFLGYSSAAASKDHKTGFRAKQTGRGWTPARDFASYPEHIAQFVERFRGVVIENDNALKIIRQHDSDDTLFYCDPPYPLSTRYEGAQWGHCYRYDMSDGEHRMLAEILRSVRGMTIISTYQSALYDRLFSDWTRIEFEARGSGQRASVPRREVIYCNHRVSAFLAEGRTR